MVHPRIFSEKKKFLFSLSLFFRLTIPIAYGQKDLNAYHNRVLLVLGLLRDNYLVAKSEVNYSNVLNVYIEKQSEDDRLMSYRNFRHDYV